MLLFNFTFKLLFVIDFVFLYFTDYKTNYRVILKYRHSCFLLPLQKLSFLPYALLEDKINYSMIDEITVFYKTTERLFMIINNSIICIQM